MPLKTPICSFDAKTGILCPKCDGKLRSGQITQADVEASVTLTGLAEKLKALQSLTLVRAWSLPSSVVLELGQGNLAIVRGEPGLLSTLADAFGRKLWVLEAGSPDRKFLEDLFYPAKLLTVNIVYLPDGSKMTKVIVKGRRTERFPHDLEDLKQISKALRGIELLIEFQQEMVSYAVR
jgi:transcription antitermination factor NusA-like protein